MPRRDGGGDRGRLFVSGLLPECEDEDLERHFAKFGRVDQASVCRASESDMSHCCGFVWMRDASAAAAALEAEAGHSVWEHPVQVSRQPDPELAPLIDELGVPKRRLPPDRSHEGPTRASPSQADDAAETAEADLEHVREERAVRAGSGRQQQGEGDGRLFVGKLDMYTSEAELEAMLSEFGRVDRVEVVRDQDNVSKFGFVKMSDQRTADLILDSGYEFKLPSGKRVTVGPYTGKMRGGRGGGGAKSYDGGAGGRRDGGDRHGREDGARGGRDRGGDRDAREGGWDGGRGRDGDGRGRDWDGGRAGAWGGRDDQRGAYARSPTPPPPPPPPPPRRAPDRRGDRGPQRDHGGGAYAGGGAYVDGRGGGPSRGASRRSRSRGRPQPYARGGSDRR